MENIRDEARKLFIENRKREIRDERESMKQYSSFDEFLQDRSGYFIDENGNKIEKGSYEWIRRMAEGYELAKKELSMSEEELDKIDEKRAEESFEKSKADTINYIRENRELYPGIEDSELEEYVNLTIYRDELEIKEDLAHSAFLSTYENEDVKYNQKDNELYHAIENIERLSRIEYLKKEKIKTAIQDAMIIGAPFSLIGGTLISAFTIGANQMFNLDVPVIPAAIGGAAVIFASLEAMFGVGSLKYWLSEVKKKTESIQKLKEAGIYDYLVERLDIDRQLEDIEKEGRAL